MGGGVGGGIVRCCLEDGAVRDFGIPFGCCVDVGEVVGNEVVERGVPGTEDGGGNVIAVETGVDTTGTGADASSGEVNP